MAFYVFVQVVFEGVEHGGFGGHMERFHDPWKGEAKVIELWKVSNDAMHMSSL